MNLAERILETSEGTVHHAVSARVLPSTQDTAVALLAQIVSEELPLQTTLILARRQLGGKGRGGRRWLSPPGGLYLTWVRSCRHGTEVACLPMVAAAAAVQALDESAPGLVGIKWPNDLVAGGGKLGGILINARSGGLSWAAVGLGVNLTSLPEPEDDPALPPTRLADHLDLPDWEEIAPRLAGRFAAAMERLLVDPPAGIEFWRQRLVHREGEALSARLAGGTVLAGTFAGLTPEGHLRLATPSGERTIASADVIHWED